MDVKLEITWLLLDYGTTLLLSVFWSGLPVTKPRVEKILKETQKH